MNKKPDIRHFPDAEFPPAAIKDAPEIHEIGVAFGPKLRQRLGNALFHMEECVAVGDKTKVILLIEEKSTIRSEQRRKSKRAKGKRS